MMGYFIKGSTQWSLSASDKFSGLVLSENKCVALCNTPMDYTTVDTTSTTLFPFDVKVRH